MNEMLPAQASLARIARMKWWEPLLWLVLFALPVAMPAQAPIINETAIWALFALSLDLVLGYAGLPPADIEAAMKLLGRCLRETGLDAGS